MYTVHHKDLKVLLETVNPASVLLVDPNPNGLPEEILTSVPTCRVTHLTDDIVPQLQAQERHELGIVANTLEHMDRKTAGAVLARLRDLDTRRFVALAPIGKDLDENQVSSWEAADFLAYGMTLMARYQTDGKILHLYHYAIESYKTTPEWFNSKNWAHPDRWKP
jgi:hypothetical protein